MSSTTEAAPQKDKTMHHEQTSRERSYDSSTTARSTSGDIDAYSSTEPCVSEFSMWLDEELAELEERFRSFWTTRSIVGSLGR